MKYNLFTLGELVTIKYGKNQKKVQSEDGVIPIYGTGGLMGYATEALYSKPSVLIGRKGTINKVRYVDHPFWTVDTLFYTEVNEALVIPKYLYYLMSLLDLDSYNEGTTIPSLRTETLNRLEFDMPDLDYQEKVLSMLEPIDMKIKLSEEVNENLAEQAQGILYHFMDEQPYQLQPLADIAIVIDCLHSKKPSSIEDSTYQLIQLDNIRDDGFLDMSATRYMISQADYENWTRKCEIVEGDCVITNVGRIGAVSQAPHGTKAAMGRNMTCIRLKPEIKLQAYFITVLLSNHMRRQIQSNTDEGTIMGALNVKNIPKLLFPIFEPSIMTELEGILFPLRKQIEYNNLQNQTLAELRDVLLPKLMSGELDVSVLD